MEGTRAGDQEAFERLYREHFEAIYAYVTRRAARADTPDLVANVFATAWRRIPDVPDPPEEKLWLFGVARRIVSQHNRGTSRRQRLNVKVGSNVPPVVAEGSHEPWGLEEKVLNILDGLKPEDRELVTLIVWDGLTHAEVAAILGCSANAVGIRWHRVLKRLRRDIGATSEHGKQTTPH